MFIALFTNEIATMGQSNAVRTEGPMRAGSTQVWSLGFLAVGTICSLIAFSDGTASRAGNGLNSPTQVVVPLAPSATEATVVHSGCAPAPTSALVVNVRDTANGAKGDGVTDDTAAIQRAVDAVAGTGGTVLVPDGTYMVNAVAQSGTGIRLKSSMTMSLSSGAVLKAIPNAAQNYAVLSISFTKNVVIIGGTIVGERSTHLGSGGEWGMGISMNNSENITIDGVTAKDCWGDGFYITNLCKNVTLCNVTGDHNRRQGLSVTSVEGLVVRNSTFKNTTGTEPECGIDIEPNDNQTVNHVLITGCTMTNNAGSGFQCGFNETFTTSRIFNTIFDSNTCTGNGLNPVGGGYKQGVVVSHSLGNVSITNNVITGTRGQGIMLMSHSANTIIDGNTITGTLIVNGHTSWTGGGIYISQCPNSTVTNNTVKANAGNGIWLVDSDPTVVISGNTVTGNAGHGIMQTVTKTSVINAANTVFGNGKTP